MDIDFILVEPKVPENIGASARAIKTMGFSSLNLVNPCEYLEGKARWVAHGSYDILENARVFTSLNEAVEGSDLVIGTTARHRITRHDYLPVEKLLSVLEEKALPEGRISMVFGREESGLTNQEMDRCDIATYIPMKQGYPSLNLSQAVMIYAWELTKVSAVLQEANTEQAAGASLKVLKEKINLLFDVAEIKGGTALKGRVLERISLAGKGDVNLVHSVVAAVLGKLDKQKNS